MAPRYAGLLTSQPLVAATLYGDAIRRKWWYNMASYGKNPTDIPFSS